MKKFVAFYMMPIASIDEMMKNNTPEQQKAGMDNWMAWMKSHEASFVDRGAPLGKNKRVTKDGASDVRNEITGYSVVQAESHDEAVALFADSPHLQMPGAYVDVLELMQMPGM